MKIIQINTMQNYKYQLSAPSSTETLIFAVKGLYLFEPEVGWGGEKLSRGEKENKQNSNGPGLRPPGGHDLPTTPSDVHSGQGGGCVCVHERRGRAGKQGIIRAEWWVVAMSDDCRVELRRRTNTAFINARRPSQCRQQHQCNNCVRVCVVRGGGVNHHWYEPPC